MGPHDMLSANARTFKVLDLTIRLYSAAVFPQTGRGYLGPRLTELDSVQLRTFNPFVYDVFMPFLDHCQ